MCYWAPPLRWCHLLSLFSLSICIPQFVLLSISSPPFIRLGVHTSSLLRAADCLPPPGTAVHYRGFCASFDDICFPQLPINSFAVSLTRFLPATGLPFFPLQPCLRTLGFSPSRPYVAFCDLHPFLPLRSSPTSAALLFHYLPSLGLMFFRLASSLDMSPLSFFEPRFLLLSFICSGFCLFSGFFSIALYIHFLPGFTRFVIPRSFPLPTFFASHPPLPAPYSLHAFSYAVFLCRSPRFWPSVFYSSFAVLPSVPRVHSVAISFFPSHALFHLLASFLFSAIRPAAALLTPLL